MPVIPNIGNTIRAIQKLTNDLTQDQGRPRRRPMLERSSGDNMVKNASNPLSEKTVIKEIIAKEGVKANVKLIQTEDELVGTIIDLKV